MHGVIVIGNINNMKNQYANARSDALRWTFDEELWSIETPSASHATPMTYMADGRQFIVIASGGHMFIKAKDIDDWLVAYALPEN